MKLAKVNIGGRKNGAFSLLEVMVAIAIFFGAIFAIMEVVSNCLADTRHLERPFTDASVIASYVSLTNKLSEGVMQGDVGDLLGEAYNGSPWVAETVEAMTNKLFAVHIRLEGQGNDKNGQSEMTILLYRPQSDAGSMDGATMHR